MKQFKADKLATKIYKTLLEDVSNGGSGLTRHEIQKSIRMNPDNAQWGAAMKKVRLQVETELDLIVPETNSELGYRYMITDDPNMVVPGMLIDARKVATHTKKIAQKQRFVQERENQLDNRLNAGVVKQVGIIVQMQELVEQAAQNTNQQLRDLMDARREARSEDKAAEAS